MQSPEIHLETPKNLENVEYYENTRQVFRVFPVLWTGILGIRGLAVFQILCVVITMDASGYNFQVKQNFIDVLTANGVCNTTGVIGRCHIQNVEIICGTRTKRDANG